MPKPLKSIEKQTLFLISGHSKNNDKLCHGVENGVGELSFLSGLLVAFGTLVQPLGLLWGPLGYLSVTLWLHFHKKSIKNVLQEGI